MVDALTCQHWFYGRDSPLGTKRQLHALCAEASRVGPLTVAGSRQLVCGRGRARHDLLGQGLHPPGGHVLAALKGSSVLLEVFLGKVCVL